MKNLFSVNAYSDDDGLLPELKATEARTISEETAQSLENSIDALHEINKKIFLPMVLLIIKYVLFAIGIILLSVSVSSCAEVGINNRIKICVGIGAALLIAAAIIFIIEKVRERRVMESDEYKYAISKSESVDRNSLLELNIPSSAPTVDIFMWLYKTKKDGTTKNALSAEYDSTEMYVFEEKGNLCLADLSAVYSIAPISSFKKIEYITKKSSFSCWNKDEAYNKGIYKEYRITADKYETEYYIKNLCSVQFELNGEEYEIIVPPYDIYAFENILGLKAQFPIE